MGLDVGTKTLGLALSDVTRTIASGLTTLSRSQILAPTRAPSWSLQPRIDVGGLRRSACPSTSTARTARAPRPRAPSPATWRADADAHPLWDERLSTAAAERTLLEADLSRRRRAAVIDKVAATLILQSALDPSLDAGRDVALSWSIDLAVAEPAAMWPA